MQSTERNASANANINSLEKDENGEIVSISALCKLQELQIVEVLWDN